MTAPPTLPGDTVPNPPRPGAPLAPSPGGGPRFPRVEGRTGWILLALLVAAATAVGTFWLRAPVESTERGGERREDVSQLVGQLFIVGFVGADPSAPGVRQAINWLREGRVAGVLVLGRNLAADNDPAYVEKARALAAALKTGVNNEAVDATSLPPLLTVDQEGGPVQRLRGPYERLPQFADIGALPIEAARAKATATARQAARQIRDAGFNVNFSPVVDVYRGPPIYADDPAEAGLPPDDARISQRAFGADPDKVSILAGDAIRATLAERVLPAAKHFPGHGASLTDSHRAQPAAEMPLDALRALDLVPFAAALEAGVPMVMTAHIIHRQLDPNLPATVSPRVLNILREGMKFDGVIVADDMTMDAIRLMPGGSSRAAVMAIAAGADLLIYGWRPEEFDAAYHAVLNAVEDGRLSPQRIREAATRVKLLRERLKAFGG
jgi:beta-N-acetylhexosaminidase